MKTRHIALGLLALPLACAKPAAEPAQAPEPPREEVAPPSEPAEEPPALTEEEQRAAAEAEKLAQDRAKMRAEADVELARFTPELRARAKALAGKSYTTLKAGLDALLPSDHRKPGHAARDQYRHPRETLEFFGVKPTSVVLEYSPGEGWYTELLAPLLAQRGALYVTTTDPNGPAESRATLYAERLRLFLDKSPELYGKVEPVLFDPSSIALGLKSKVDVALVIRGMHGWVNAQTIDTWLEEIHAALKKNGVLGIVQHRAPADADPKESARRGYLPEAWVIQTIEARGFRLASKSEVNANPKDTKDYPEGVWALPPSLARGDKDRDALVAIGESDRMTLRFVRVDK